MLAFCQKKALCLNVKEAPFGVSALQPMPASRDKYGLTDPRKTDMHIF
jgi:hypothetical protein